MDQSLYDLTMTYLPLSLGLCWGSMVRSALMADLAASDRGSSSSPGQGISINQPNTNKSASLQVNTRSLGSEYSTN